MATLLKFAVLPLSLYFGPKPWQMIVAIVISGVVPHVPENLRYCYLLYHD